NRLCNSYLERFESAEDEGGFGGASKYTCIALSDTVYKNLRISVACSRVASMPSLASIFWTCSGVILVPAEPVLKRSSSPDIKSEERICYSEIGKIALISLINFGKKLSLISIQSYSRCPYRKPAKSRSIA